MTILIWSKGCWIFGGLFMQCSLLIDGDVLYTGQPP